jgi:hypothetical protein
LRIDPPAPKRKFDITFYSTFLNTTGAPVTYRMIVYIFRPNESRSMGESYANLITVPPGSSEFPSPGWVLNGPGGCEDFIVHVGWVDDLKRATLFSLPSGQTFQIPMTVCP